jgi:hypothetical protein
MGLHAVSGVRIDDGVLVWKRGRHGIHYRPLLNSLLLVVAFVLSLIAESILAYCGILYRLSLNSLLLIAAFLLNPFLLIAAFVIAYC